MTVNRVNRSNRPVITTTMPEPSTPAPDTTARGEVEARARDLVERGQFATIQKARSFIYELRPELSERVRAEAQAAHDAPPPPVHKRQAGRLESVLDEIASRVVKAGKAPSLGVAKGRLLLEDPTLQTAVRKERGDL